MPLNLTTPDVINGTVTDEEINAFSVDITNGILFITYDRKASDGAIIVPDVSHTLSGAEMVAAIARASEIAGADVYAAIKQALYEFLPGNGTIN